MKRTIFALLVTFVFLVSPILIVDGHAKFPNRPVTLVLPVGAGGSHDLHARGITGIMSDIIGQPMIVKLLPGGAGMRGHAFVANAKPDGLSLIHI